MFLVLDRILSQCLSNWHTNNSSLFLGPFQIQKAGRRLGLFYYVVLLSDPVKRMPGAQ